MAKKHNTGPVDDGVRLLFYDVQQTCTALSIGRTTLYSLIDAGELHPIHLGRSVRFHVAEVEAYAQRLFDAVVEKE